MAKLPPPFKKAKKGPIVVRAAPSKKPAHKSQKVSKSVVRPLKPSLRAAAKPVRKPAVTKPLVSPVPIPKILEKKKAPPIPNKIPETAVKTENAMKKDRVQGAALTRKADVKKGAEPVATISPPSKKEESRAKKTPQKTVSLVQVPPRPAPVAKAAPLMEPSAPPPVPPAPVPVPSPLIETPAEAPRRRLRVREVLADDEKLRRHIEALLFSSGKAMPLDQLAQLVGCELLVAKKYLEGLQQEYEARGTALKVFEENGTWRMLIKDEHVDVVRKVVAETELSRAALETLAVIAYKYPKALQSVVVNIRGGNAYDHIRELEEKGFVSKNPEGRSFLLKLTDKFFEYFDVESPEDIKKVFDAVKPKELQQKLGDLDVVEVLPETAQRDAAERKKKTVDGLEVVDVPPPNDDETDENDPNNPFLARKLGNHPEVSDDERASHADFLKGLDAQIDALSKRNAEYDQDETFKRAQEPPDAASGEGTPEDGVAPSDEEPSEEDATENADETADESAEKPKKSALDEPLDLTKL